MASPRIIEIDAEPREYITVKLVGVTYEVLPPKDNFTLEIAGLSGGGGAVDLTQVKAVKDLLDDWIDQAFADQAGEIHDRLRDPKDLLDIRHIMQLMEKLVEATTGNPTSSPSASPASRGTTGRTSTGSRSRSASPD